jgi:hypothetical protein
VIIHTFSPPWLVNRLLSRAQVEVAIIIDGFPQDGNEHLMDIYATTNPNDGGYYWQTSVWNYRDTFASEDREIVVIPYGQACKQINFASGMICTLRIDLNVTGADVYNVGVTTNYIPESCQSESNCENIHWSDPSKRCCLYDAYDAQELGRSCKTALENQAKSDANSILGENSACRSEVYIFNMTNKAAATIVGITLSLVILTMAVSCIYVIQVSESRKAAIKRFLYKKSPLHVIAGRSNVTGGDDDYDNTQYERLTTQLVSASKLDRKFGGIIPSSIQIDVENNFFVKRFTGRASGDAALASSANNIANTPSHGENNNELM